MYVVRIWPSPAAREELADVIVLEPVDGTMPIFGDVEMLEDGEAELVVWSGTWYSVVAPEGEPGTTPLDVELRQLSREEFDCGPGVGLAVGAVT